MVGQEQQRNADAKVIVRTCRVALGVYTAAPNHYLDVVLPFKRVLAVSKINMSVDTWTAQAIRVIAPNVMRIHVNLASAAGVELVGPTDIGNAEVVCVLPMG